MVDAVIRWCLKNAFLVIIGVAVLLAGGYYALVNTPSMPIPDIGEKQVIVFADWPGRSPQDVDNQVTYPLTTSLTGTPGVKTIRSMSGFGFAMVFVIFKDEVDYYWARSACDRAHERRAAASARRRDARSSARTPRRSGRSIGIRSRAKASISRNCAASRTGICAINSTPSKASAKSRASAAS
jgi:multidrug efflux pump subunit AcrB